MRSNGEASDPEDAAHIRHDVADVRILFDGHELIDPHAAEIADASKIVPFQVHKHDMLRPFLRARQQFTHETSVIVGIGSSRAGARNRPGFCTPSSEAHQPFGRRADQREIPKTQQAGERRRIDPAKLPVERMLIAQSFRGRTMLRRKVRRKAMREVRLIDISGGDVGSRTSNPIEIGLFGLFRRKRQGLDRQRFALRCASLEPGFPFCQSILSLAVKFLAGLAEKALHRRTEYDLQAVSPMIHRRNEVVERKLHVGNIEIVRCERRQRFETACEVIAEVSNGTAEEGREIGRLFNPRLANRLAERLEGVFTRWSDRPAGDGDDGNRSAP